MSHYQKKKEIRELGFFSYSQLPPGETINADGLCNPQVARKLVILSIAVSARFCRGDFGNKGRQARACVFDLAVQFYAKPLYIRQ
jgi:hypothetical protein